MSHCIHCSANEVLNSFDKSLCNCNIFQINSLVFDENSEITAMISAEGEEVPLKKRISPNAANVSINIEQMNN